MPAFLFLACIVVAPLLVGVRASSSSARWQEEQRNDMIQKLPGQPGTRYRHYSGYITVNDTAGRALFYWLAEANNHADSKPLILWLNGGPGCSSLAYGAMEEIGPFRILPDGAGLFFNKYSWTRVANIIFLESPAGVGFSYTNTSSDLLTSGDIRTAQDAHTFVVKWFERFPQYKYRDFYLAGESYAGHYVPQLAKLLYERNVDGKSKPEINFKGFLLGNAVMDSYFDSVGTFLYWWDHALISDTTYNAILKDCDFHQERVSAKCVRIQDYAFKAEIGDLDPYSLYTPTCTLPSASQLQRSTSNPRLLRRLSSYDPCTQNYAEVYFNRPDVQKAMHANSTQIPYNWTSCSDTIFNNWQDMAFSVLPIYKELIGKGLKIWIFSGDVDAIVPVTATRLALKELKLPVKTTWYPWYLNKQVGGHCEEYENLTFVTVRGAGHEVPTIQPGRAMVLIKAFLSPFNFMPKGKGK